MCPQEADLPVVTLPPVQGQRVTDHRSSGEGLGEESGPGHRAGKEQSQGPSGLEGSPGGCGEHARPGCQSPDPGGSSPRRQLITRSRHGGCESASSSAPTAPRGRAGVLGTRLQRQSLTGTAGGPARSLLGTPGSVFGSEASEDSGRVPGRCRGVSVGAGSGAA